MEIYVYNKKYFKLPKEAQIAVRHGAESVYKLIKSYEDKNIDFLHIFNDDKVKYNKHGKFYTFKYSKGNYHMRLLYSYLIIDGTPIIIIGDFFMKKQNNHNYINQFDLWNKEDPYDIYNKSQLLCAV